MSTGPSAPQGAETPTGADAHHAATTADRIAAAVTAVPGVVGLHGGAHGEVATYLPGRRVTGVRLRDERCSVHVVLEWGSALLETSERVRAAAQAHLGGTDGPSGGAGPVDVVVEDVVAPAAPGAPGATAGPLTISWRR
ncbi:hypothetical protein GCM10023340_07170 [Nocardioides marinquilinus]|uniref:Asp23/Gls24 family envelope stress response protein n=1 Tax=Nocardioides marinquilinus TaxID=1210400 RepID=A0ABP9P9C2_9ACTN